MTTTPDTTALQEAAEAVVRYAETDDQDGEYIDYVVPAEWIDALRAALAAARRDPEPGTAGRS